MPTRGNVGNVPILTRSTRLVKEWVIAKPVDKLLDVAISALHEGVTEFIIIAVLSLSVEAE